MDERIKVLEDTVASQNADIRELQIQVAQLKVAVADMRAWTDAAGDDQHRHGVIRQLPTLRGAAPS